jgi:hypothetical protein
MSTGRRFPCWLNPLVIIPLIFCSRIVSDIAKPAFRRPGVRANEPSASIWRLTRARDLFAADNAFYE